MQFDCADEKIDKIENFPRLGKAGSLHFLPGQKKYMQCKDMKITKSPL